MNSWVKLKRGECLEVMATLPDNSVDMVCCDLPYGTTSCHWDVVIPFSELWAAYCRVLAPGGCVLLFGNGVFSAQTILSNLEWYKQTLIWDKNKCGSPGLAKVRPMQVHEDIHVFAPGRTVYNPQMEAGEPYSRTSASPEGYVGKHNRHGYGLKPKTGFTNTGTRYPKSILRISRDFSAQQQVHPTQKPVPLLEWLIRTYSNEDGVVMDNCMGSGTAGVAAVQCRRNFIGIEADPEFFRIAKERITLCSSTMNPSLCC